MAHAFRPACHTPASPDCIGTGGSGGPAHTDLRDEAYRFLQWIERLKIREDLDFFPVQSDGRMVIMIQDRLLVGLRQNFTKNLVL